MNDSELAVLAARIAALPGPVRLVAIDGPGGCGKTTFAARLSDRSAHPARAFRRPSAERREVRWPARADERRWPRMLEQVILPLAQVMPSQFQRYDWPTEALAEWHDVERAPVVIIEGVSAGRSEWAEHLSFVIWIETPRDVRLRRGLERDGPDAQADWQNWMTEEDLLYEQDQTTLRADLIIDGTN